ncbi:hypothetical protein AAHE18_05G062200 [Arachis hypogaea]
MKELVTIQLGDFANYVGSHFWNFQDELLGLAEDLNADSVFKNHDLNMDVLYRTGETQQVQFLEIELALRFNEILHLQSSNLTGKKNLFLQRLYEEEENLILANDISSSSNGSQNEYQDKDVVESLENGAEFWTDYSKVHYHLQNTEDFNNYRIGKDSFSWALQGEEISDRLRLFVEECDHIQGFQFVVDDSRGFSAVAEEFLENIVDKYTNTPVLLYAVQGHRACTRSSHAVSFSRVLSYSKLIVPLGKVYKFLHIEDEKHYHSSAIYAAALHSINLSFRMEPVGLIDAFIQMLSRQERQNLVSVLDVAIPAPTLSDTWEQNELSLLENLHPLTPQIAEDVEDTQAVECIRYFSMKVTSFSSSSCKPRLN